MSHAGHDGLHTLAKAVSGPIGLSLLQSSLDIGCFSGFGAHLCTALAAGSGCGSLHRICASAKEWAFLARIVIL